MGMVGCGYAWAGELRRVVDGHDRVRNGSPDQGWVMQGRDWRVGVVPRGVRPGMVGIGEVSLGGTRQALERSAKVWRCEVRLDRERRSGFLPWSGWVWQGLLG